MSTIPAIYEQGVFRPTQPVDLPENCEVVLQVAVTAQGAAATGSAAPAEIEARLAALAGQVPASEWAKVPPDLSDQLDHYIYGTPKQ